MAFKKIIKIVSFCAIFLFAHLVWAKIDLSFWKYYKDVTVRPGWNIVKIDDEIIKYSTRGLRDLRIVNDRYEEVPYKILGPQEKIIKFDRPKIISNTYLPGKYSQIILDLGEKHKPVNSLRINTISENFHRNVSIYASNDKKQWQILKDKICIYDYTDRAKHFHAQKTKINFPETSLRYLKLEISDPNNNPVKINSVNIEYDEKEKAKELKKRPKFKAKDNANDNSREIFVDLGAGRLPVNKIELFTDNENFGFPVQLLASFDGANWHIIGNYYIFKYDSSDFCSQNLVLQFEESNERYFKIIIFNQNDELLKIIGLEFTASYNKMIFLAEKDREYRLYYGNQYIEFPEYDLEKNFSYVDLNDAYITQISSQYKNSKFTTPEQKIERNKKISSLLEYGIIIASIILLILIFRFIAVSKKQ